MIKIRQLEALSVGKIALKEEKESVKSYTENRSFKIALMLSLGLK